MKQSFFAELKRRHVYRVAIAYAVVGWLLVDVATQVFPFFHIPDWSERLIVFLVLAGFPIALVLAWAFELTPEGVRRTAPADSPEARPPEHHRRVGRMLDFIIIAVLVGAVALLTWQRWGIRGIAPTASGTSQKSVAVLPFENLSTDKANAYFADGMQDLILTKLAEIGELKVISRTSTAKYAARPDDLKTIAAQLGVANVLEGSVQKAGNSVLINVQLINARTDAHIWAHDYTRTLDNVFGVEGEVAEKIAVALKAKLSPAETKRLATALSADAQANDLFLRAEYFANRGWTNDDTKAFKLAIPLYRQALARVPDFALAHAQLSITESLLAWFGAGVEDVRQLDENARTEAERAMQLAPDMAESHLAIGYSDYYGKSDYDGALKAFAVALTLRPNDADALAARGFVLRRQGRFDEAVDAFQQSLAHDPRNSVVTQSLAVTYMATGRYVEAEQASRHALMLDPGNDQAKHAWAHSIALRSGDLDRALAKVQGNSATLRQERLFLLTLKRNYRAALALLNETPDTPDYFGNVFDLKDRRLADLYRLSGNIARARVHYAKALPQLRSRLSVARHPLAIAQVWSVIAAVEIGLGDTTAGVAAIRKSLAEGERSRDHLGGSNIVESGAERYAQAGRADKAAELLARALATPGLGWEYSPVMLWIDPVWDPIRKDAAFRALLEKYAKYRPAKVPDGTSG